MTRNSRNLIVCLLPVGLCLGSCQTQRSRAMKTLARELSARKEARIRSMALYEQGRAAFEGEDWEEAERQIASAAAADGRNAHAWIALGVLRSRCGRPFEAASAFHRASQLVPNRPEPHFNLGSIFESAGHYTRAIEEYEKALNLAPNDIHVMENLTRCHIRSGIATDEASEWLHRALLLEDRPDWRSWLKSQIIRSPSAARVEHGEKK